MRRKKRKDRIKMRRRKREKCFRKGDPKEGGLRRRERERAKGR